MMNLSKSKERVLEKYQGFIVMSAENYLIKDRQKLSRLTIVSQLGRVLAWILFQVVEALVQANAASRLTIYFYRVSHPRNEVKLSGQQTYASAEKNVDLPQFQLLILL